MAEIRISLDNERVREALRRAPEVIQQRAGEALGRGAEEAARAMKQRLVVNRSMARSTLANSIRAVRESALHYVVAPGVAYARMVEEGTGPAAGRPAYTPNLRALEDYVRQRAGVRMSGRPNSPARRRAIDEVRDRAWALAMHIRRHGTRPHPFVEPTRRQIAPRVIDLVERGVARAVQEVFGA